MEGLVRLALLVLCACSAVVKSYPYGAPIQACVDLTPQHPPKNNPGTSSLPPQSSASRYSLEVTKQNGDPITNYTAGEILTVTIRGGAFKGFLVKAQRVDPAPITIGGDALSQRNGIGTFTVSDSAKQLQRCDRGGLTHSQEGSNQGFNGPMALTWTAPALASGHLEFLLTVVQDQETFWTRIRPTEKYLMDPEAPALPTEAPVTVNTDPLDLSNCGPSKGCYTRPNKCTKNCDLAVTWTVNGNGYDFAMSSKEDYVALGLSNDQSMGDDSVVECIKNKELNGVRAGNSINTGQSNAATDSYEQGISDLQSGEADGQVFCRFTHDGTNKVGSPDAFYLLLAGGSTAGISKLQHSQIPLISSSKAKLSDGGFISGDLPKPWLIKVHGALMMIAWVMFASVGILMARYYKDSWPNSKLCGEKVWFAIHRTLMVSVFLLTVAGIIVIFVHVEGWSDLDTADPKILRAHPYLGIIVLALAITNPIMAVFRPHPGESNRVYFNWAHWAVGTLAHTVSIFAVFLGLSLPSAEGVAPDWLIWIMVAFVAVHILCDIVLEIHKCTIRKNKGSNTMEMQQMGADQKSQSSGGGFRLVVLMIYVLVVLALGLCLVITVLSQ